MIRGPECHTRRNTVPDKATGYSETDLEMIIAGIVSCRTIRICHHIRRCTEGATIGTVSSFRQAHVVSAKALSATV